LVLANTRASADDEATAAGRHSLAAEVLRDGVDVAASELLPKLIGTSTTHDHPELVDHVHALILENKEAGVAGALRAMASRRDATPMLGRIQCPVVVVAGEEDLVVTPASARAMAGKIRDARVEVLLAGHLSNLEAPDEFNRVLADFARASLRAGQGRRARAAHG
jgi:pimeloyl-ACP methyl ester carboxylesterase